MFSDMIFTALLFVVNQRIAFGNEVKSRNEEIVGNFDNNMKSFIADGNLFEGIASLQASVYEKTKDGESQTVFEKSYGMTQFSHILEQLKSVDKVQIKEFDRIGDWFTKEQRKPDLVGVAGTTMYRIASNTKTFMGSAALLMVKKYGLNLDEKVAKYIDLKSLGFAHGWREASKSDGFIENFPNASVYINSITFRHLLDHQSGLSREAKRGENNAYGSSRTSTPACPSVDVYHGILACNASVKENNWRPWTKHVTSYLMPACGYAGYVKSSERTSCLPGEYYHYSNVGFSIVGLAMDSYLKTIDPKFTIEEWIQTNIFDALKLKDAKFTWSDLNSDQRARTAHGCQGGKTLRTCNFKRALTDYVDRGIKAPPGGVWSTTRDLGNYLLKIVDLIPEITQHGARVPNDDASEEEPEHMPAATFQYDHGWYIGKNYSCDGGKSHLVIQGAWGTVPGFSSYMITNSKTQPQFAVVLLRSFNYGKRLNLGNQARKLLWRLTHPKQIKSEMTCPVYSLDERPEGDRVMSAKSKTETTKSSSNLHVVSMPVFIVLLIFTRVY